MDMLGVDEWRSPNGDDRLVRLIADYDLYHTDVADALEQVLGKRIGTKGYTVAVRHTCPYVETQNVLYVQR